MSKAQSKTQAGPLVPRLLRVKEVAERLAVSPSTVHEPVGPLVAVKEPLPEGGLRTPLTFHACQVCRESGHTQRPPGEMLYLPRLIAWGINRLRQDILEGMAGA